MNHVTVRSILSSLNEVSCHVNETVYRPENIESPHTDMYDIFVVFLLLVLRGGVSGVSNHDRLFKTARPKLHTCTAARPRIAGYYGGFLSAMEIHTLFLLLHQQIGIF